jgi:hypothetical protein
MASGKSNYLSNKLLNQIFNGGTFTPPTTLYCALYTSAPTASTSGTEVSGGSYSRVAVAANTTNFPTTTTQSISNGTSIIFPTAGASWGTVVAAAFLDASTGGNLLYFGSLTSSVTVATGNTFEFLPNSFLTSEG